jgi:hypothetical protein
MKNYVHLGYYLTEFFLEWEIRVFQTKIRTQFMFFLKSCHLWHNVKNIVQPDMPKMTIWRMRFACWINKVPDTNSEYVIFIAFPRQHMLRGRAPWLRHTHIASYVCCGNRKEWGLRLSPRCCWRFYTFVMWRCLNLKKVTTILRNVENFSTSDTASLPRSL